MASQSSKRVLITGAEGYLGSVIALFLIEQGYEVTGLDTGFFKDATLYDVPKYPVLRKDARDFSREDLENIDVVKANTTTAAKTMAIAEMIRNVLLKNIILNLSKAPPPLA